MPDSKITALTALTAADPANDMFPVVDVSDTTMAASGTTKRISINNILACSPSATLASATITGALGAAGLNVTGATIPANGVYLGSANNLSFSAASTLGMTLNSTGLGIGTTILGGQKLAIGSSSDTSATTNGFNIVTSRATIQTTCNGATDAAGTTINYSWANGGQGPLIFRNAAIANVMTLDASGNVGIGVTPSAWGSASYSVAALQNSAGAFWNYQTSIVSMIQNAFYNNSAQYIYRNNGFASEYYQSSGQHIWRTVASGTAGNAITFTQAMALDASGRLLVGTTVLNASWDTRLTLSSDSGTTRWAVGPYAAPQNFVISSGAATGVYLNGTAATSWTSASDERLKDIIEPISNAVSKVASLRAVIGKFKFDENNTRKPFLIAQDIQAVLPEAVDASNPDQLGVSYTDVIPLLVAAIKELTARVQTLEAK